MVRNDYLGGEGISILEFSVSRSWENTVLICPPTYSPAVTNQFPNHLGKLGTTFVLLTNNNAESLNQSPPAVWENAICGKLGGNSSIVA